jgi:hypothetical protein
MSACFNSEVRTGEPDEEIPDVDNVRWETRGVVVHLVCLARLARICQNQL